MVIDIVIIVAFLLCIIIGAKKGFAKTLLGLFSYIVSIIIGIVFYDKFLELLYSYEKTALKIAEFQDKLSNSLFSYIDGNTESLPAIFAPTLAVIKENTAQALSKIAVEAVIAVLFVIAVVIIIKLLSKLILLVVKLPVLKQFNSILGGAVGAINGIIVCYIIGAVVLFFFINSGNEWIINQLDAAIIGQYFYKNNLILNMLIGL